MGALSKLDAFILNPQVRTCSVAVLGTSTNNNPENRKTTGHRSLDNPCPEMVFSACHTCNLNDSEQEETHQTITLQAKILRRKTKWQKFENKTQL